MLLGVLLVGKEHDHLRRCLADVRVELVPTWHRLHFELAHGASLISGLVVGVPCTADAGVVAKCAWVPFERHLLDMELTEIDLAFRSEQGLTLLLERLSDADDRLLLLQALRITTGHRHDV